MLAVQIKKASKGGIDDLDRAFAGNRISATSGRNIRIRFTRRWSSIPRDRQTCRHSFDNSSVGHFYPGRHCQLPFFVEFFKHFPGIFTGLGIIGTFSGLVHGLSLFKISDDASTVRLSLQDLMSGVSSAFIVSASAISVAMIVTVIEKLIIALSYQCVEKITFELDKRFQSGVGEEYLSRLVIASESWAAQAGTLKDALVTDLKQIMTELMERQTNASIQATKELGQQFAQSLNEGMKTPLEQIANPPEYIAKQFRPGWQAALGCSRRLFRQDGDIVRRSGRGHQ